MYKSYFKIAWRNLLKDHRFTLLNLTGLSTGLACALLIFLWVNDELNTDKYNEKDEQLYQVLTNLKSNDGIKTGEFTPGLLAAALKKEMPEVAYATTVLPSTWFPYKGAVTLNDKNIKAGGDYVSRDYFNVFTCHFIAGEKENLFSDKQSVAISADLAEKLFGNNNAIGSLIKWDQGEFSGSYKVVGVFDKNPANATRQFDLLFNFELVLDKRPFLLDFGNSDPNTYVIVKPGVAIDRFNSKIKDFIKTKTKDAQVGDIFLAKYSDKYLHDNYENGVVAGGRITYVKLFSIIAIFILLIACINFMNLSTAKAGRRLKEVGIKKVMGARRGALVLQYISESLLMVFISLMVAILIAITLLPVFNSITGKQLALHFTPGIVFSMAGITLLTGLLAGSYPALYLSRFSPVKVLKGDLKTTFGEFWIRKGLVVFQFTLSVVFIAAVLILYRQLNYIQSKNLGYSRDNIIHFEIPLEIDSVKISKAATFVQELQNIPGVVNASSYYHNLTGDHGNISGFDWPGKDPAKDIDFVNLEVGDHFLETAGIQIISGRNFSSGNTAQQEIVFNETAIKAMGLKDPVGKMIRFWGQERRIVGIAGDFNFESLYQSVKPCFFQVYPVMPNVMVKIKAGTEKQTISKIQKAFATFSSGKAFDYRFLDEDYQALYISEERVGKLAQYFAGLAIIISCLGLFGLAAFTAQKRKKEIGIRKVVGASVSNVTFLLSKEFLVLILVAMVIAFPVVWLVMNNWLDDFAYRIAISADIFMITGACALLITIGTISFQSIKAALANPVNSLRTE